MDVSVALALLGLSQERLSKASVKEAFELAAQISHPDKNAGDKALEAFANNQMRQLLEARTVLLDYLALETSKVNAANVNHDAGADSFNCSYGVDIDAKPGNTAVPESRASLELSLDEEQQAALNAILSSNENFLITGKAGTGKSYLLMALRSCEKKSMICMAPTGRAARNIHGVTLHSFFGYKNLVTWNVDDPVDELRVKRETRHLLTASEAIVIDEVSMVRADVFAKIDRIMRHVLRSNKPFGGKQVILFGDIFQLPPVTTSDDEARYLDDMFGGPYFFEAPCYTEAAFNFVELSINHRQKEDKPFFDALNSLRDGSDDGTAIDLLNNRVVSSGELGGVIQLFPTKTQADSINKEKFDILPGESRTYTAISGVEKKDLGKVFKEGGFPVPQELTLKVGEQVMFVANNEDQWSNGTIGTVHALRRDHVEVSVEGHIKLVFPCRFEECEATYKNGKIRYEKVVSFEQLPLVPAYAMTIHKSQGLTCDRVACDVSGCFSFGQAYVAISRCKSLEGLYLLSPVAQSDFSVDPEILKFYYMQLFRNGDHRNAPYRLSMLLLEEDVQLSAKLLEVAAREGNPDALYALGDAFSKTDIKKAALYYEEALRLRMLPE